MKKKILLIPLALLLAVSLVAIGCPAPAPAPAPAPVPAPAPAPAPAPTPAPAEEVYHWVFSSWASRGMFLCDDVDRPFIDTIEAASGGRLTFDFHGVGELVEADELFGATKSGVLDMASSCGYHVGELPFNEVEYGLPMGLPELSQHQIFWDERGAFELAQEVYLPHNLHLLSPRIGGPIPLLLSKKEVRSLDDIKGLKVRAYGAQADILGALGATVIWVPFAELYTALATGVVDGVANPSISEETELKLYEVASYLVLPPLNPHFTESCFVNLDSWNALPEDLQAIVSLAAIDNSRRTNGAYVYGDQKGRGIMEAGGVEFVTLPPEDVVKLRELSYAEWDKMAAKDPTGNGAKFVKLTRDYMEFLGY